MKKAACAILALCLFACSNSVDTQPAESAAPQHTTAAATVFDMDQHQFAAAFNAAAKSLGQPFRIDRIVIRANLVDDYFQQQFEDHTALTVAFSKDSARINSITGLVAEQNGSVDMRVLAAIGKVIMHTVSPELSQEKISKIVADMMGEASAGDAAPIPQRYFGHARYTLRSSRGIGSWWIADPS